MQLESASGIVNFDPNVIKPLQIVDVVEDMGFDAKMMSECSISIIYV